jgi:hypothetical protein
VKESTFASNRAARLTPKHTKCFRQIEVADMNRLLSPGGRYSRARSEMTRTGIRSSYRRPASGAASHHHARSHSPRRNQPLPPATVSRHPPPARGHPTRRGHPHRGYPPPATRRATATTAASWPSPPDSAARPSVIWTYRARTVADWPATGDFSRDSVISWGGMSGLCTPNQ